MLRALLLTLCGLAVLAPAALAQEDDIQVDPGSPSGKEYALPVDSARSQAAPKGSAKRGSSPQPAPLFGEGVQSDGDDSTAGSTKRKSERTSADDAAATTRPLPAPATLRAQAGSPDGGSALAVILGVGAGVLLVGGLIGLALRRRAAR